MLNRVAGYVGKSESEREEFYHTMHNQEFLPNSPTLMNAGHPSGGCLSACFVVPVEDTIESILDGVKHAALICKAGGGVGYSFSKLREANSVVQSTHGVASGPISFMQIYDAMTETIKQGGRRRGANMGVLHCQHPDIMEFISCKHNLNFLNNFNLSVAVTDAFMEAVKDGSSYPLISPHSGEVVNNVVASDVWNMITQNAWENGEPGVIFIDTINKYNPTPYLGKIDATNPCGEQPLLPYESCNLGSINLAKFVVNKDVDWHRLKHTTQVAVRFLDRVIDVNQYPLPEIARATERTRKIGLGVMGWADMLVLLDIPYNSLKALNLAERVMGFINEVAYEYSMQLGVELGGAPCYTELIPTPNPDIRSATLRNATRTTIAPTGTISILAGCSSGIEPLFKLAYLRTIMDNETFIEIHPILDEIVRGKLSEAKYKKFQEDLLELGDLSDDLLSKYKLHEVIDPKVWITSHQVKPEWHIKMQAAFQKHVDNAVSKTINLPVDATVKEVSRAMEMAWKLGVKGVTVYRDGARPGQVLSGQAHISRPLADRPDTLIGKTDVTQTGCGKLYITQNYATDNLFEVFLQLGKAGGCETAQTETTGRLISLALRSGIPVETIAKQLIGIRCPNPCWSKGKQILSCFDAAGKVLASSANIPPVEYTNRGTLCPDCNYPLEIKGGCESCPNCGFEKCK